MSKTRRPTPTWETRQRKESRYVKQKVMEEERAKEAEDMLREENEWWSKADIDP